ncbi:MAG: T9SS type A sorting domain-containing protein [Bacteroidetes bacterium]|nr:T9SS type A sorting domain-containing protein [Bacteroidota bacterium]
MKTLFSASLLLPAVLFLGPMAVFAQGTVEISTNKAQYGYGEVIEIRMTISNPTDQMFELSGSTSCQAQFLLDDFNSYANTICTLDDLRVQFSPGSWRSWIWTIDPPVIGLPASVEEHHTLVGYYPGTELADTTTFDAPQFLGGRISVGIGLGVLPSEIESVKDSLLVEVLSSHEHSQGLSETWQISGVAVDSAVVRYVKDSRFSYFEALRYIGYAQIVAVEAEPGRIPSADLIPAYPNPCHDKCTIGLVLTRPEQVRVVVYDILGREVETVHEGFLSSGLRHLFSFDARSLVSGLYLYRAEGDSFSASGSVFLVK